MSGHLPIDVMISSTSLDLPDHRKQAIDAVKRCLMNTWEMETLGAGLGDAISVSLKLVDKSEIYLGIIGMRYGFIPDDPARNPERLSITEMEYRRALERKIPILIFIMDKTHLAPERKAGDPDTFFESSREGKAKLKRLKDEMKKRRRVAFFTSAADLRGLIIQALNDEEVKAAALARAGELDPPPTPDPDDIGIPIAPALYSVPPYTLTSNFIGRAAELKMLDQWAQSRDPLLVVEAIGGMGKSALTWEWVQRLASNGHTFDGILWYSFYEGVAQMSTFLRHALAYVRGQKPDALKKYSHENLVLALLAELSRGRYLLVMDGLERVLVAYHRLDASQVRDDQVQNDLRDCISHKDSLVLQKLAGVTRSKLLVSSRLMPRALEDAGDPIPGVRHYRLAGLYPDDALRLMADRGVKWDDERALDEFMRQIGYHGLLLKVVAGRIKTHRRARGHFDTWYDQEGKGLDLYQLTDDHRRTHVLKIAFEGLDDDKRRLLSQIAAFSDAVDYDTLSVFNPYIRRPPEPVRRPSGPLLDSLQQRIQVADNERERATLERQIIAERANIDPQTQAVYDAYVQAQADYEAYLKNEYRVGLATFDAALTELEDRGLLQWDRENNSYDLHPVVRGYGFDQLQNRKETFDRIHDYFQQKPQDKYREAQTLDDLRVSLEVYRALVSAGRLDAALGFYRGAFAVALFFNLGAYHKIVQMLTPLFPEGQLDQLPLTDNRSFILDNLGFALRALGQTPEALYQYGRLVKLDLDAQIARNLATSMRNYGLCLGDANRLGACLRMFLLAEILATAAWDRDGLIRSKMDLTRIYTRCGRWPEATAAYLAFHTSVQLPRLFYRPGSIECAYAELQFYRGEDPRIMLNQGLRLAEQDKALHVQMEIHALRARVELAAGHLAEAERALDAALALARRSGSADQARFMALLAEIRSAQGQHAEARKHTVEALEMTAFQADRAAIYHAAAIVYHAAGDDKQAGDYAVSAYGFAWADGEPFSNWYELKRARAMLKELGLAEPRLPPFDPAKVEKIPYKDEIRAFIAELKAKRQSGDRQEGE